MSLKSTLLRNNSNSKPSTTNDDIKDTVLDEEPISKSGSQIINELNEDSLSSCNSNHSDSISSSSKPKMDYTQPLCFYSQVGHIDSGNNDKSPESALHIILPNNNICLGYSIGYKIDDSMDIVDGDVWLYRPQNYSQKKKYL
eukprot:440349_1